MRMSGLLGSIVSSLPLAPARRKSGEGAGDAVGWQRGRQWRQAIAALLVLAAAGQAAPSAPRIEVERDGETYTVHASADLAADLSIAWDTLTDYERLPEFVPDIHRVRVLARDGNRLTVVFDGGFRLLLFEWPVRMRLVVRHEPYGRVRAQSDPGLIDGREPTLRSFSGQYTLTVVPVAGRAGVRLDYDAKFELTESVPTFIDMLFGRPLVRAALRREFEAMLGEIERRQAARSSIQRSTS
jgi:hypothetical protein